MGGSEHDPALKDRVHRLMQFLRELVKARSKPVRDVERHEDVIWLDGASATSAYDSEATRGGIVLRARRISLEDPPRPPSELVGKIVGNIADSAAKPRLTASASRFEDAFDRWLAAWRMWAAVDTTRRPAYEMFEQLQRAMQDLGARPESIELVLATGLLTVPSQVVGDEIRTHIISQAAVVERDERSGDLIVRLTADGDLRLEDTQSLSGLPMFDGSGSRSLRESLVSNASSAVDPFVNIFLKEWADRALTVRVDVNAVAPVAESTLNLAPALVLRKRGAFALVDYYDRMIRDASQESAAVPLGLAQLVAAIEPEERISWLERTGSASSSLFAADPLFPLPANSEQREILDRLAMDSGVVVEGPPGTGKTHTIANLVCALLASGQRVLVTSEKAQALRVVRDKLPAPMQELCVSIIDVNRGGSAELNRSVAEIATRKSAFSKKASTRRIDDLVGKRTQALGLRTVMAEQIRSVRERETHQHSEIAPGYAGTAAAIVRKVVDRRADFEWLPGPLHDETPTLDADHLKALVLLTQSSTPSRARRSRETLPVLDEQLPPPEDLRSLCRRALAVPDAVKGNVAQMLSALEGSPPAKLAQVQGRCESLSAALGEVRRLDLPFQSAADGLLSGRTLHLWSKTREVALQLNIAVRADRLIGARVVECQAQDRRAFLAYDAMAAAMQQGTEWRSRFLKSDQQKAVEGLGPLATVDGYPAQAADTMRIVAEHLRAIDCVRYASLILADLQIPLSPTGTRSYRVNALFQANAGLTALDTLATESKSLTDLLRTMSRAAPRIYSIASADELARAAGAISAASDAKSARLRLTEIASTLSAVFKSGPSAESESLIAAVANADFNGVIDALNSLATARREKGEEEYARRLFAQLEAGAPALASLVATSSASGDWTSRFEQLEMAWAWRRAHDWVEERRVFGDDQKLDIQFESCEADIADLTGRLAAERAWLGCLERMTAEQVQALQAYREHVTNIGRGTGKYAERYRTAARAAMLKAQGAVPAWVMPLQQVLATIPPEPNTFDVVIIDEASQADIANLFLLWLAPRVIVVGDDKQCAPSEVSSGALDAIFEKLDTFLPDMPVYLRDSLTPRSSLFSMLRTRFGQVVRLREHFRSMPEIINWSSNQFYRDAPLIPVRQFGADRLPPLRTTYVESATVEGKNATLTNRVEAQALVDAIVGCIADRQYDGKTMGVVVLQGQSQADEIQNQLLRRLDADVWEERRLRVGTPPDFQGDERNVVFVSMVIAPEQRYAAMTKNEYQRRFNVAASRAQDQLWLFHSVAPERLKAGDLRHSLLTYMLSTSPAPAAPMPTDVTPNERHTAFDNLFEQSIFLDIARRGYHVNPQVEVNSRAIDLVVTGAVGKLAVECDGDSWQASMEQQSADFERERELKRCGWHFWRIRESAYYLDPETAMATLWTELASRRILPNSVTAPLVERSADWRPAELPNDESLAEDVVEVEFTNVFPAMTRPPETSPPRIDASPQQHLALDASAIAYFDWVRPLPDFDWVRPIPRPSVPSEVVTPHVHEPADDLGERIINSAAYGAVATSDLAEKWGLDTADVRAAIKTLIRQGRMRQVGIKRGTRYELVEGEQPGEDRDQIVDTTDIELATATDDLIAPVWEYISSSRLPRSVGARVLELVERGSISDSDIAAELGVAEDQVRAVAGEMVARGVLHLVQVDPRNVYAHPNAAVSNSAEDQPDNADATDEEIHTDNSNPFDSATTDLLVAASEIAAVTLTRAMRLTGLSESEATRLLGHLESVGRLLRISDKSGPTWVRGGTQS